MFLEGKTICRDSTSQLTEELFLSPENFLLENSTLAAHLPCPGCSVDIEDLVWGGR